VRCRLKTWQDVGSRINAAHRVFVWPEVAGIGRGHLEADLEFCSAEKAFAKMDAQPMRRALPEPRKKSGW